MIDLPPIINEKFFKTQEELTREAYSIFQHDFIDFPPKFHDKKIETRKEKMENGYLKTFWHVITEGDHRENDKINNERLVRIPWINPAIEGQPDKDWMIWKEQRSINRLRIHIYSTYKRFLIVIEHDLKTNNNVFWTAFPITENHQDKKYKKKYQNYLANKT